MPDLSRAALEDLTVAELRTLADDLDLDAPAKARKADLVDLIAVAGEPSDTPPDDPRVDPRLAAARDAEIAREAATRVGRPRPVPAHLDPRLAVIAEETRQADARSVRPASEGFPRP